MEKIRKIKSELNEDVEEKIRAEVNSIKIISGWFLDPVHRHGTFSDELGGYLKLINECILNLNNFLKI